MMAAYARARRRNVFVAPARRERAWPRTRVLALPAIFAILALAFGTAPVHGQATGGDIFNVNPGGSTPKALPPSGDYFGRDTECGGTDRRYYDNLYHTKGVVILLSQLGEIEREQWMFEFHCGACGQYKAICWKIPKGPPPVLPNQPTALPEPGPMRNPQQPGTDCRGLLAQARATAAAIEGGSTGPAAMQGLIRVLQQCPPAFPRPIQCFDMMVDAQSKVRTSPDYSRRRAQDALLCYEKQDRGTPNGREPPTFHYFYINGINTPLNGHPRGEANDPGGTYEYEYGRVRDTLLHTTTVVSDEQDVMGPPTHNWSGKDEALTKFLGLCGPSSRSGATPGADFSSLNNTDAAASRFGDSLVSLACAAQKAWAGGGLAWGDVIECLAQSLKISGIEFTSREAEVIQAADMMLNMVAAEQRTPPQSRHPNFFILVAHSQGNFFAEGIAYRLLHESSGTNGPFIFWNRLGIVSLGSPTRYDSLPADFVNNQIRHITRADDGIHILDALSMDGLVSKQPWDRSRDVAPLWPIRKDELQVAFATGAGPLRVFDFMNMGLPALATPFMNAHLLDNYLSAPTATPNVLKGRQREIPWKVASLFDMSAIRTVIQGSSSPAPAGTSVLGVVQQEVVGLKKALLSIAKVNAANGPSIR
jgi:hypothetical protein